MKFTPCDFDPRNPPWIRMPSETLALARQDGKLQGSALHGRGVDESNRPFKKSSRFKQLKLERFSKRRVAYFGTLPEDTQNLVRESSG
jgi:hypothetical protein